MILRPIASTSTDSVAGGTVAPPVPAWDAIVRAQHRPADAWWLVSQPDHAALSGTLAAAFAAPGFPAVEPLLARAIGLHDAGWAVFASEAGVSAPPPLHPNGRPLAFFEIAAAGFLRAWTASVERARQIGAAGGYIVSKHFSTLGEYRLRSADDPPQLKAQVQSFVAGEQARQARLWEAAPQEELEGLVRVLQFCDLLSLYLCCGAREAVDFPQEFAAGRVRAAYEGGLLRMEPSPFQAQGGLSVAVAARRWPPHSSMPATREWAFLLA